MQYHLEFNKSNPKDMTGKELALDYAVVKTMADNLTERLKELREPVISAVKREGVVSGEKKTILTADDGSSVTLLEKVSKVVDTQVLSAIAQKKSIEIGKIVYTIRPKGSVPKKVLEMLDKYFELEEKIEVTVADVEAALAQQLITKKEFDKIVVEKPIPTLYATVSQDTISKVIK